jgi:hypothetical protein
MPLAQHPHQNSLNERPLSPFGLPLKLDEGKRYGVPASAGKAFNCAENREYDACCKLAGISRLKPGLHTYFQSHSCAVASIA